MEKFLHILKMSLKNKDLEKMLLRTREASKYLPKEAKSSYLEIIAKYDFELGNIDPDYLKDSKNENMLDYLKYMMSHKLKIRRDLLSFEDVKIYNNILVCRNEAKEDLKTGIKSEFDETDEQFLKEAVEGGDIDIVRHYMKVINTFPKSHYIGRGFIPQLVKISIKNKNYCILEYLLALNFPEPTNQLADLIVEHGSLALIKIYKKDSKIWNVALMHESIINERKDIIKFVFRMTDEKEKIFQYIRFIIENYRYHFSFVDKIEFLQTTLLSMNITMEELFPNDG